MFGEFLDFLACGIFATLARPDARRDPATGVPKFAQFGGQFSIARGLWLLNPIDYARAPRFLMKS